MMYRPLLTRCYVVIVDEIHKRSIQIDLLLATIDSERLRAFFEHQTIPTVKDKNQSEKNEQVNEYYIMSVEGHSYPIEIYHTSESVSDYRKLCIDVCIQIHENEKYNEQVDVLQITTFKS